MAMPVPPVIEWRDGAVRILDQRRLPDAVEVLHCTTVAQVNEAIRTLAIRGAPALGVAAAYAVALAATRVDGPDEATYLERLDSVIDQSHRHPTHRREPRLGRRAHASRRPRAAGKRRPGHSDVLC